MRISALIVGLACLVLAGCAKPPPTFEQAHADLVGKIDKAVKDPTRAQQVSESTGRLLDEQRSMAADLKSTLDQLAALNADFNASDDHYRAIYSDYQKKRMAAQMKFKDRIFELRKQVSAEEWKEITK